MILRKNKRTLLLICVIVVAVIVAISAKGFSLFDTSVEDSLKIFVQINLKNDFTDAKEIGLGDDATIKEWQQNYQKINKHYFDMEFKNTLSDEKLNELVAAELVMNKKRQIKISDVKVDKDTATATVAISRVDYSTIVDKAVKTVKAQKAKNEAMTAKEFSAALADELIKGYKAAEVSSQMSTFSIKCKKELIDNNEHNKAAQNWFSEYVLPHFAGHCWYPQDFADFSGKINKAVES